MFEIIQGLPDNVIGLNAIGTITFKIDHGQKLNPDGCIQHGTMM